MPWKNDPQATTPPEGTFPIPTVNPQDWFRGSANSWPKPSMQTTSLEQIQKQAQVQQANTDNRLSEFGLKDVRTGSYAPKGDR
jgi:hypothetical protein